MQKVINRENILVAARSGAGGWEWVKWVQGVKRYELPVINVMGCNAQHVNIVNNTVLPI